MTHLDTYVFLESLRTGGHKISIKTSAISSRPKINFLLDNDKEKIGFHFNPRYDQHHIVMNSYLDEMWGPEEYGSHGGGMQGSVDTFGFIFDEYSIRCWWNQMEVYNFRHRVPLQQYAGIEIAGFNVMGLNVYKDDGLPWMPTDASGAYRNEYIPDPRGLNSFEETPLLMENVALMGRCLEMTVTPVHERPKLNFLVDNSPENVALHFNPRFDFRRLVRNSKHNGAWGQEETDLVGPLYWENRGQLELKFYVWENIINCLWDGREVCSFWNRTPAANMLGLEAAGWCVHSIRIV